MKRMTPLLTLLTGTGMAAVLFAMSAQAAPRTVDPRTATNAAASPGAAVESPAVPAEPPPDAAPAEPAEPAEQRGQPAPSPTSPPAAPPAAGADSNWTGRLDGGATIAITVTDGKAVAYVCDGKKLEVWLNGTAANGRMKLTGKKGEVLTGSFGDGVASGEMVVGQRRWKFTAKQTGKPDPVLYRATSQQRRSGVDGGWIMLPDGSQIGVVTRDGEPVSAPPLDPAFGTTILDGRTLTAAPVTADPGAGE
ncbi:hypothetical protein [Micromonospora rifamycinica]|uniref:Uncharacterized protein n=1 Tax=Micromonospora rifamycinica TaxID=291594 RepID=A0A109IN65_9ACTN|nr:hypothetical protein [Micromonospora rifamycinica]KWV33554.1 hypothetical protein AWV63_06345 [Micromonospora rifamycinica]SCG39226.1 hypothetical protein GA0070623_0525 [Micromonospora rifamycinica]